MSLEHLLLRLSVKKQGSWSQFRSAVEELCTERNFTSPEVGDERERTATAGQSLPIYQRARFALQRLGHVEFFWNPADRDWRVVPPTLALLSRTPGEALLCGARSPDLLRDLAKNLDVTAVAAPGTPDRVVAKGSADAVVLAAARLKLFVQMDAPTAILSTVPSVRDPATWFPTAMPETPGWTVHRFSSSRLRWVQSAVSDAQNGPTGLFRFVMKHQRAYYLRWRGLAYRVPGQVGKYAVMRKRRMLLAYDASEMTLSVPAVCRPPLLIERALVLCSGYLPSFDPTSRRVAYSAVPPEAARLVAQLLRQELAK